MTKYRNFVLILFIISIDNILTLGQCDNIELHSQEEVNNFIKKYGKCKTVQNLKILDSKNDLVQFDSLYHIERIEGRFEFQNITETVKNLDGFRNLKFVNDFNIIASNLFNTFLSLDTVNHLRLSIDTTCFRAFNRVKFIRSSLWFLTNEYCMSNHLTNFMTGPNFALTLWGGGNLSCLQRLSDNIETKNLRKLNLRSTNHVLSNYNFIDSLETLILWSNSSPSDSSDFSEIQKLTNLKHIEITGDKSGIHFGEGFKRTFHLDTLILSYDRFIKDYQKIFPHLKTMGNNLSVFKNDALISLDFLKEVRLRENGTAAISIVIRDNKLLNDCNVTFLCEALSKYPNAVIIENNGAKCTKEEILKYCVTVNTLEERKTKLVLVPNPTFGYLRIENVNEPISVNISNMSGKIVKTMSDVQNEINIEDLPQGMYIVDVRNKEISERYKIVKVE